MIGQYCRFFRWHVFRHLRRHPLLATLNVLSVALGVAVYLATQIANHSANRAFAATVDMVAGKADLEITALAGNLPETVFPLVATADGISAATPLVRGFVTLPDNLGEYLEILGTDVFTNAPFRTFEPINFGARSFDIERWLAGPGTLAVTEEFLAKHKLRAGDKIHVRINVIDHELEVGFILRSEGLLDSHFAAMDIGWAQELVGRRGELSAIQLRLANPQGRESTVAKLRKMLPPNATVAAPAQRSEEVEKMLSGFELNLAAMSLLSLIVGMFLIYNTVSASVARRHREIGILRSLGVTRNEVRALFLGEAIVLGSIGAFLGLVGGVVLARFLVGTVSETISSLYVLVNVNQVALDARTFAIAWVLGMGAVIISAWLPAHTAAQLDPVRALHGGTMLEKSVRPSPAWLWGGLACLLIAIIASVLALSTGPRWLGFVAAFAVLGGSSCLVPWSITQFALGARRFLRVLRRRSGKAIIEAELSAMGLSRALLRNSITVAALAAAVAMTVGVSVMVFSFRETVESWINETLLADLFIAPASSEIVGASSFVPPAAIEFLSNHPTVETVETFREVDLSMGGQTVAAAIVRGGPRRHFLFIHGDTADTMRRFREEPCVIVSESFARRHHLGVGESIELMTPEGDRRFPVAGVFYDYSRDQGIVYMSQRTFGQFWRDDRVNSVGVYLKEMASRDALIEAFRGQFNGSEQFVIYSNQSLRARIFQIFDQTFAVTYVLRTTAVIVAITGIFLSLTILITERSRELAIMRALGGSAGQVRKLLLWETAMLGVLAAMIGVASGLCLSLVLTGVINRAFFGWTIRLAFPWSSLVLTPFWIFAAAVITGILPAWRAGRLILAESLRSE